MFWLLRYHTHMDAAGAFMNRSPSPIKEIEMSELFDILSTEIPDSVAYAAWLIGSPLLAWLAVTLFV